MELKAFIDKDIIENNTDTCISDKDVHLKASTGSITCAPIFTGICKKLADVVKNSKNVEMRTTLNDKGENIVWVTVISNSETSKVFEPFKSMGMFMPRLSIGLCETSNTIYTSAKLCRDLAKFSDNQKAAIVMYLISLATVIKRIQENMYTFTYDAINGRIEVDVGVNEFTDCFKKFTEESTWYLKDSNDDNYVGVKFWNYGLTSVNDQFANHEALRLGFLRNGKDCAALVKVNVGASTCTFVIGDMATYTDFDLCNLEITNDSICATISSASEFVTSIGKVKKLPISGAELVEYDGSDFDDFVKAEKIPARVAKILCKLIAKGCVFADVSEFNYLVKEYGVSLPKNGSKPVKTVEEMKEVYKDDAYAQELYKQIQPYYDTYKLDDNLDVNLAGFSTGALYSMVFIGASGTGKSTAARVIPARCGIPYVSVNFSVNIEESDLFGSMVPNTKKVNPEDPEFVWTDGIVTKAVRNGYCVVLEELNFARPGVLGKLNSLLDENRQIDLPTGEIVRANKNFRIIATCNIAYEGTNRFNKALINRFDDVTVFTDLDRTNAVEVIKQRTGYTNVSKINKVYDVYEALKKFAKEQNVDAVVSMRQLINIFNKGKYYKNAADAVQRIMINGAFIEDEEYRQVFNDTVIGAFDLKFKL